MKSSFIVPRRHIVGLWPKNRLGAPSKWDERFDRTRFPVGCQYHFQPTQLAIGVWEALISSPLSNLWTNTVVRLSCTQMNTSYSHPTSAEQQLSEGGTGVTKALCSLLVAVGCQHFVLLPLEGDSGPAVKTSKSTLEFKRYHSKYRGETRKCTEVSINTGKKETKEPKYCAGAGAVAFPSEILSSHCCDVCRHPAPFEAGRKIGVIFALNSATNRRKQAFMIVFS